MRKSAIAAGACAAALLMGAPLAVAQEPVSCWDYNTLADNVGSRFGLKGAADDTILSRSAYYSLTKLPAKVSAPLVGGYGSWFKIEIKAEAQGAEGALALSGLLIALNNVQIEQSAKDVKYEDHVNANGKLLYLRLLPLEARFRAGDQTIIAPFRTQGPDFKRQEMIVRLGAFAPETRPTGAAQVFDPQATLPLAQKVDTAWRQAGTMTIEFALPDGGAVVATSEPLAYPDGIDAEFARMNGQARKMLNGGKCQYLK
jgi:hypothetical protein